MDDGPVLKYLEPVEAAEDGLGAAHRGSFLGCDGCNRYDAKL